MIKKIDIEQKGGESLAGNFAQTCSLREPLARVFEENSVVSVSERTTPSPRGKAPKTPAMFSEFCGTKPGSERKRTANAAGNASEIEAPYELPEGWKWVNLLDTFENKTSSNKKLPTNEYCETGSFAVIDQGKNFIGGYSNRSEFVFDGELPVIVFGDHTKCIKFVDFAFIQGADGIKVLKPIKTIDEKYFYYGLKSINFPDLGYRRHFPIFKNFKFPIPPTLAEQQRIVNRIENLFAKLDEAKEKAQNAADSFETRRAAILHQAFTGSLTAKWRKENGVSDDSWEEKSLGEVVSGFKYGISDKCDYSNSGIAVLRIPNIANGFIDFDDLKFSERTEIEEAYIVKPNDILIIRSNGSRELVGKSAIFDDTTQKFSYGSFLIKITPSGIIDKKLLVTFLNSEDARYQMFNKAKSSSGIHNINSKELSAIRLNLPTLPEQQEIVRILDTVLEKERTAKSAAEQVLEQIDLLKKSILARAFRGEL